MVTMFVMSMVGIVLTFALVLNSITTAELFDLFIYGGNSLNPSAITSFLNALRVDYYLVIVACLFASGISYFFIADDAMDKFKARQAET